MTKKKKVRKIFGLEWSWGTGIFFFLIFFLAVFGFFIWWSFQQNINMVDPDYYDKGVQYDKQLKKLKNNSLLEYDIVINQDAENVTLIFPDIDGEINGNVWFYYTPNSRLDVNSEIILDKENHHIQTKDKLIQGAKYTVKVDWSVDSTEYYFEKEISIE